ncbi:hypothetical protein Fcan01_14491 [Folsomia candida]|uniref:Uncharacterized protein n=1 Tax=Folsomia candida TaxID=158441 RepID=A0A226E0I8_FOLCA|nr:hypothetical protein Fcan01_14491 [Folsomia candida]
MDSASNGPIAWDVNSAPVSEAPSNHEAIESIDQPPPSEPPPPKPPAPRGAGYKLMLLIWKVEICILVFNLTTIKVVLFVKNLLIRKRHWFVTGMEIILPLLFAGLIVLTSTGSGPVPDRPPPFSHSPGMYEEKTNNKSDLPIDVTNLHKSSNCDSPRDRCTIGWAPEKGGAGNDVDAIRSAVEELKTIISPSITDLQYFESEKSLEDKVSQSSFKWIKDIGFKAGVIFGKGLSSIRQRGEGTYPYKIRMMGEKGNDGPMGRWND